jgi:flagellar basal-body rod protein FlgG
MDKTLRTAATGLTAQQRYVEIISNNIANVNTTAFKKVRPEFQDLLYESLRPAGANKKMNVEPLNEVQIGSGVELTATSKIFKQGDLQATSNKYDIAINGEGFFMLRKGDNSIAYTRDGTFHRDKNGQIVNAEGYILEPGLNVPDDAADLQISTNGEVTAILSDGVTEQTLGQIELARFVNPAGLRSVGENIYSETPASGKAVIEQPGMNNTGELKQNQLEVSNVNIVDEMVNMITAQRAYEMNSKSISTADNILGTAVNLKRS